MRSSWHNFFAALPLATAAAFAAACGGSAPPADAPSSTADAGLVAPPTGTPADADAGTAAANATPNPASADQPKVGEPEKSAFDKLSKKEKVDIMVSKVVPNVGKIFKEHDSKEFAKFGCTTCHGPDKKQDPHDVLPKLTLSNGGFEKLAKSKPAVVKWMTAVETEMAADLGEPAYDPKTHKGFGCGGCHTVN